MINSRSCWWPWPVCLSWLSVVPQSKRSLVQFLVKAHAWVEGSVPGQELRGRKYIKSFLKKVQKMWVQSFLKTLDNIVSRVIQCSLLWPCHSTLETCSNEWIQNSEKAMCVKMFITMIILQWQKNLRSNPNVHQLAND